MPDERTERPPRTIRDLEAVVLKYAEDHGQPVIRVRRSISFTILGGILARCVAYDGTPLFWIKGGVAIERRLGATTRATKDFDAIFRDSQDRLLEQIDHAFEQPYGDWKLRRSGDPEDIGKALRIEIKLEWKGRSWGTIPFEISAPEGTSIPHELVEAVDLSIFGLTGPEHHACLPVRRQIAQKLHGMTQLPKVAGRENPRFQDLFDSWRLVQTIGIDHELRAECKQTFRIRAAHSWPPTITVYQSWPDSLARMAKDEGLECPQADELAAIVQGFIAQIDALSRRVFASDFGEIQTALVLNTDLKDDVYALVLSQPIPGKATEGSDRVERFRAILERLVGGEIDVSEAVRRTELYLSRNDSPHGDDNRVFASGWAVRLVRTQYSRFYNQAVAEHLLAIGESRCLVPHSSSEADDSACSLALAGRDHGVKDLYDKLVKSYVRGEWDNELKIPNHPHCTHVLAPVNLAEMRIT